MSDIVYSVITSDIIKSYDCNNFAVFITVTMNLVLIHARIQKVTMLFLFFS